MYQNSQNSFILYSDLENDFDYLSSEEAGEMIKAIFAYVNHDIKPSFHDRSMVMLFNQIIRNVDRNAEKWEETKQRRSVSGHNGGVISGERRRQKQIEANEAKRSIASTSEANEAKRSIASTSEANEANEANEAVNVNVNVNDNVNVNGNVIVNGDEEETTTTTSLNTEINKWCYEHLKPCKKDNENKKEIENIITDNSFDVEYLDYILEQTECKYPKANITSSLILQGAKFETFLIEYKKINLKRKAEKKKADIPKPPEYCPVCHKKLVRGGIPNTYECSSCGPSHFYEYDHELKKWVW